MDLGKHAPNAAPGGCLDCIDWHGNDLPVALKFLQPQLLQDDNTRARFRTEAKVQFKLWGKVELTEEEQALINKYRFHDAILIAVLQPFLLKQIAFIGGAAFLVAFIVLSSLFGNSFGFILGIN